MKKIIYLIILRKKQLIRWLLADNLYDKELIYMYVCNARLKFLFEIFFVCWVSFYHFFFFYKTYLWGKERITSGKYVESADPAQISELLSKTIADAHARTCLVSTEQIQESFRKPADYNKLIYYKDMGHEQLWLECAQKLTTVIQQIIEFAKMVPGFMKLSQDDQIVLLKAGT